MWTAKDTDSRKKAVSVNSDIDNIAPIHSNYASVLDDEDGDPVYESI